MLPPCLVSSFREPAFDSCNIDARHLQKKFILIFKCLYKLIPSLDMLQKETRVLIFFEKREILFEYSILYKTFVPYVNMFYNETCDDFSIAYSLTFLQSVVRLSFSLSAVFL